MERHIDPDLERKISLLNYLVDIDHKKVHQATREITAIIVKRTKSYRPLPKDLLERQVMLSLVDDLHWLSISVKNQEDMIGMHKTILKCIEAMNMAWKRSQQVVNPGCTPKDLGEDCALIRSFIETAKFGDKVQYYDQCCNQLMDLLNKENIETISNFLRQEEL